MKRSNYSDEQIICILKEHQAGMSITELCRKCGVCDATFHMWCSKYGGMEVSEVYKRGKSGEQLARYVCSLVGPLALPVLVAWSTAESRYFAERIRSS